MKHFVLIFQQKNKFISYLIQYIPIFVLFQRKSQTFPICNWTKDSHGAGEYLIKQDYVIIFIAQIFFVDIWTKQNKKIFPLG